MHSQASYYVQGSQCLQQLSSFDQEARIAQQQDRPVQQAPPTKRFRLSSYEAQRGSSSFLYYEPDAPMGHAAQRGSSSSLYYEPVASMGHAVQRGSSSSLYYEPAACTGHAAQRGSSSSLCYEPAAPGRLAHGGYPPLGSMGHAAQRGSSSSLHCEPAPGPVGHQPGHDVPMADPTSACFYSGESAAQQGSLLRDVATYYADADPRTQQLALRFAEIFVPRVVTALARDPHQA